MNKFRYSVSVIIPVYNTEKYLPRALDSLSKQSLPDIEIVIVNDGSLGNCNQIVKEYQEKLDINYVNLIENKGRMIARIEGMKAAKGEYIGFLDPDDYVEPNMFGNMHSLAKEKEADIVHCLVNQVKENNIIETWTEGAPQHDTLKDTEVFEKYLDYEIIWSLVDKLFRRKVVDKAVLEIPYERVQINEDTMISCVLNYYSKKYVTLNENLYNYCYNENSAMKTLDYHCATDILKMASFLIGFCRQKQISIKNKKLITAVCQWPFFLLEKASVTGKISVIGNYLKYVPKVGLGKSLSSFFIYWKNRFVKFLYYIYSNAIKRSI